MEVTLKECIFGNKLKLALGMFFPSVWGAHRCASNLMRIAKNIMLSYLKNPSPTQGTVIDLIMNNTKYQFDEERATDILYLIIAGHYKTANSITMLLLELAKNPIEQFKLQKELREMNEEERLESTQLQNCMKESSRLWPVMTATGPVRKIQRDYVIESEDPKERDIMIPKNSCVFMPIICLFRNSNYFSDNEKFMPDRWNCPTDEMKKAWMPFGIGDCDCFGQSLSNCEIQSVLTRVCAMYHFEVVEEGSVDFFTAPKPIGVQLKVNRI